MLASHKTEQRKHIYSDLGLAHRVFFDLSSHKRAKKAIDFALKMRESHYHTLVIGDNQTGRITSTLSYLKSHAEKMPPPEDWVYLKDFNKENAPIPFALPAGDGILLSNALKDFIHNVKTIINKTVHSSAYIKTVQDIATQVQYNIDKNLKPWLILQTKKDFI